MTAFAFLSKWFKPKPASSEGSVAMVAEESLSRALDLGRTRLLFAEGRVQNGKFYLSRLAHVPLSANTTLPLALKALFEEQGCAKEQIRLSLKSPQVITRFLRFPKMNEKELRGVLQFEIEQYVPYESKDLHMDLAILQDTAKSDHGEITEVFVAVAKKDYLDPLLKQFRDLQSDIASIDVDMLACMQCLEFFHPEETKAHSAVLDLGVHVTTLGVVRGGKPRFIRDLSFGTQDIAKKLKSHAAIQDAEVLNFVNGKMTVADEQRPAFLESIENLINDVKVSFDYYRDQSDDGAGPDKLFVCGLGSAQDMILQTLEKSLDIPVVRFDLSSRLESAPEVSRDALEIFLPDLPVTLGLLLRHHD